MKCSENPLTEGLSVVADIHGRQTSEPLGARPSSFGGPCTRPARIPPCLAGRSAIAAGKELSQDRFPELFVGLSASVGEAGDRIFPDGHPQAGFI